MTMLSPIFGAPQNEEPSTTVTTYMHPNAVGDSGPWGTVEAEQRAVIPEACTLTNFYMYQEIAPGGAASYTYTVMKNGAATALTVTISGVNLSASDTVNSVSFAAGDTISIRATPTGTPALTQDTWWFITCEAAEQVMLFASTRNASTSAVQYDHIQGGVNHPRNAVETDWSMTVAAPGTLKNLFVELTAAPGAAASGDSYTFTVMKNGIATLLSVVILETAVTGSNTIITVPVVAGDTISMQITPTSSPTTNKPRWGIAFDPTTEGDCIYGYSSDTVASTTATEFMQPNSAGMSTFGGEGNRQIKLPAGTIKNFYARISAAPGAGDSYEFRLRRNSTNTTLFVLISDAATSGSVIANEAYALADFISMRSLPSGTPAAISLHTGWTFSMPAPGSARPKLLPVLGVD